jgi:hypothetical protein
VTQPTLLLAGGVALCVGAAYGYVATQLTRRAVEDDEARRALRSFALWWGALGVNLGVVAAIYFVAAFGGVPLELQIADSILQRLLLAVSMVGLVDYMLFVTTGRHRMTSIILAYGAYFAWSLAMMIYAHPVAVLYGRWRTDLVYANSEPPGAPLVGLAFIVLPAVVGALAYLRLYFRATHRSQKYRIAVVSSALLVWWVVAVAAGQRQLLEVDWLQVGQRFLGLLAAFAVLAAFRPPAWVRAKWGVEAYGPVPG